MPYNKILEEKIERVLANWTDVNKKKIFGGVYYLINGNICFGIYREYLVLRSETQIAQQKLGDGSVKPFNISGKPMNGWVTVEEADWRSDDAIINWLEIGRQFALSLPVQ
ncbi:MAG: TfoX/Sxy family protein [Geobacteraceae bacterium]|jgi:TfoX/Sxy family transcriptional regulator of competence genes